MKIYLNIYILSDYSKLTYWVYQITKNTVSDHYRKTKLDVPIDSFDFGEQETLEPLYLLLCNCINQKISQLHKNIDKLYY